LGLGETIYRTAVTGPSVSWYRVPVERRPVLLGHRFFSFPPSSLSPLILSISQISNAPRSASELSTWEHRAGTPRKRFPFPFYPFPVSLPLTTKLDVGLPHSRTIKFDPRRGCCYKGRANFFFLFPPLVLFFPFDGTHEL